MMHYDAADCLYADLHLNRPSIILFLQDLANPEITAPFGRVVTEQVNLFRPAQNTRTLYF